MTRLTKGLLIGLIASVVLNVFFLGFSAARFLRHPSGRADSLQTDGGAGGPMGRVWRKQGPAFKARREAVEEARRGVREALVAEPFRPEQLQDALGNLRKETDETQSALHQALVESAKDLSPEERQKLAASPWFFGGRPRAR